MSDLVVILNIFMAQHVTQQDDASRLFFKKAVIVFSTLLPQFFKRSTPQRLSALLMLQSHKIKQDNNNLYGRKEIEDEVVKLSIEIM